MFGMNCSILHKITTMAGTPKRMNLVFLLLMTIITRAQVISQTQPKNKMTDQINPLMCDPETGLCELPEEKQHSTAASSVSAQKPLKIIYFTDPICSSCWGIEPQLRKLKMEYGHITDVEYKMGGLLPDWSYNSGGISKPSDVAKHWDEVSVYYEMPIDGDLWIEDPLWSSFPPSVAFKAAQLQGHEKALLFLRNIREMVFLQKKNITKWEHLEKAAKHARLDVAIFRTDYHGVAKEHFDQDLRMTREWGVRGFPTLIMINAAGQKEVIYGAKPYETMENKILKLYPEASKAVVDRSWKSLFQHFNSLTVKEFSVLSGLDLIAAEQMLNDLAKNGEVEKHITKNGSIYRRIKV